MSRKVVVVAALASVVLLLGRELAAVSERSNEAGNAVLTGLLVLPILAAHGLVAPEAIARRTVRPLVGVWRGLVVGAVAGSVVGVGLRLGMRAVALLADQPTEFTVAGSLFVLVLGVFLGASFGSLLTSVRRWLPHRGGGLLFGALLAVLFWFPFFDAAAGDLRGVVSELVIGLATSALSGLWLVWGAALDWHARRS